MSGDLLERFLEVECDTHVKGCLLSAIALNEGVDRTEEFNFNVFNVRLDFGQGTAVIDDELNPSDGECSLMLEAFKRHLERGN